MSSHKESPKPEPPKPQPPKPPGGSGRPGPWDAMRKPATSFPHSQTKGAIRKPKRGRTGR
jgi:hypothetical protein